MLKSCDGDADKIDVKREITGEIYGKVRGA